MFYFLKFAIYIGFSKFSTLKYSKRPTNNCLKIVILSSLVPLKKVSWKIRLRCNIYFGPFHWICYTFRKLLVLQASFLGFDHCIIDWFKLNKINLQPYQNDLWHNCNKFFNSNYLMLISTSDNGSISHSKMYLL